MKQLYVTFGVGTILRSYHLKVEAKDASIVAAWLKKHGLTYSRICESEPSGTKPLNPDPECLYYEKASHV